MDISTGLTLLNMLSLNIQLTPTYGEMEMRYKAENRLRQDIFDRYDGTIPMRNGQGVELIPSMTIDHIRALEEDKGTLTISITFVFTWLDERVMWNASRYSGIRSLSFNRFEYGKLWVPVITLADMPTHGRPQDLFGNHDLDIIINSGGMIRATIKALITVPCYFSFGNWPRDYQNCSLTLMSPYTADEFRFARWGAAESARFLMTDRVTDVEDFELIGIESNNYYIYLGMDVITDYKKYGPEYCRGFYRYNIMLKRENRMAAVQVSAPLFAISIFIAMSSILPNKDGISMLLLVILAQMLFALILASVLPDSYNGIPNIASLALFMFLQTIAVFAWKMFSIATRHRIRKMKEMSVKDEQLMKYVVWVDVGLIPYLFFFILLTLYMVI